MRGHVPSKRGVFAIFGGGWGKIFFIRIMRLIFLIKMVLNMLTLAFNFKIKLGSTGAKIDFQPMTFLLLVGEENFS